MTIQSVFITSKGWEKLMQPLEYTKLQDPNNESKQEKPEKS